VAAPRAPASDNLAFCNSAKESTRIAGTAQEGWSRCSIQTSENSDKLVALESMDCRYLQESTHTQTLLIFEEPVVRTGALISYVTSASQILYFSRWDVLFLNMRPTAKKRCDYRRSHEVGEIWRDVPVNPPVKHTSSPGHGRCENRFMKQQIAVCAYCGVEGPVTRDHVPPRIFFARPLPANMVTVPACERCNKGFEADDEYTRMVLATDFRVAAHRDVLGTMTTIARSLGRRESHKFTDLLARSSRPTGLLTPSGAAINAWKVDWNRIEATGRHILWGLHYAELRKRVDPNATFLVRYLPEWNPSHEGILAMVRMYDLCAVRREKQIGAAFSYGIGFRGDISVWMLLLYGSFMWIGAVGDLPENITVDAPNADGTPTSFGREDLVGL
jgi:5-methylcytosine-specific restriction endonuclease McrA